MNHQISEPMVLPPDVIIIAPHQVSPEILASLDEPIDDHFIITRPRSRSQSRIVNEHTALLLAMFRQPFTITDATLALACNLGRDPEAMLEEVFATLRPFLSTKWLVPANSNEAVQIEPLAKPGQVIANCNVLNCVQVLEDTDVYQVRTQTGNFAALKLVRRGAPRRFEQLLRHEAMILRKLNGAPVPRLLEEGTYEEMPFMLTDWFSGVPVDKVAQEIRLRTQPEMWNELLKLCIAVVHAYRQLHERNVIHGDVYPRNVLCDARLQIAILDFGFARCGSDTPSQLRQRGVPEYHEPELARAMLNGRVGTREAEHRPTRPLCTAAGEQYAVAALLYRLVCGHSYLRFSPHRDEMLRQIAQDPPLAFRDWGLQPWPDLETTLRNALAKQPEKRFQSMQDFEASLHNVQVPAAIHNSIQRTIRTERTRHKDWITRFAVNDLNGVLLDSSLPKSSVAYGSAGIAYALNAIASATEDPALLTAADAWVIRAARDRDKPGAFASQALEITEQQAGPASVYFGACGVPLVQAMVAWAMGNEPTFAQAVKDFVQTGDRPSEIFDLAIGKAGVLQACALLLDVIARRSGSSFRPSIELLTALGRKLVHDIWTEEALLSIKDYLGISHGLAGLCYSTLSWSLVSGDSLPDVTLGKLEELYGYAQEHGRGLRWPIRVHHRQGDESDWMESWCHGTPGYVYLWIHAANQTGKDQFLEYAERSTWTAWEAPDTISTLCCGYAGRAYALLAFWRQAGSNVWIERAANLAHRAATATDQQSISAHALFKGALGVALLLSDLDSPHQATFPLFDFELR